MRTVRAISLAIAISSAFGWIGACSTSAADGDSESHFLATCPPGCESGLECICGTCTRACVTDAVCGSLAAKATCVTHDGCGTPKACDIECNTASDCGANGTVCDKGLCRKTVTPRDGGTGGQGGDASTGPSKDVSAGPSKDVSTTPIPDARNLPDGQPQPRCDQPIDTRACEFGELFVHDPQTNTCKSVGGFRCHNNENGFTTLSECLAACPDAGTGSPVSGPRSPSLSTWDGGPFLNDSGELVTCWFPGTISWISDGIFGDGHTLANPGYSRRSAGRTCSARLPDCGEEGITPFDVGVALRDPDVRAAGNDDRFGDQEGGTGTGALITIDGADILVFGPCNGATGCKDPPAGIVHLLDVLHQVERQELGRGDCRPNQECYKSPDRGPCDGVLPRFAYDPATGACNQFAYGGCGGNGNRFETQLACEEACDFDPCRSAPAIVGNPDACQGTVIQNRQLCAPDPLTACGCTCSLAGKEAIRCSFSSTPPGEGGGEVRYAYCQ